MKNDHAKDDPRRKPDPWRNDQGDRSASTERLWELVHAHLDRAADPLDDPLVLGLLGEVEPAEAERVIGLLDALPPRAAPVPREPAANPSTHVAWILGGAAAAGLVLAGIVGLALRAPASLDSVRCVHWNVQVSTVAPTPSEVRSSSLGAGRAPRRESLPTDPVARPVDPAAPPAPSGNEAAVQVRAWTVRVGGLEHQITLPESTR